MRAACCAAVAVVVLAGCTDDVLDKGRPDSGQQAPGRPDPGDGGGKGAPIRVPPRTNDEGMPIEETKARVESDIRGQCGGTLCVRVVVAVDPDASSKLDDSCEYTGTSDPAPGRIVARGGTITLYTGEGPCDDVTTDPETGTPGPDTSSPDPGGTESPAVIPS